MPIILHPEPREKRREESQSSFMENLLVRIGIGIMVGLVGFFIAFEVGMRTVRLGGMSMGGHTITITGVALTGAAIGFTIGFVLSDNISEDWFSNIFGSND